MKQSDVEHSPPASGLIDQKIAKLGDWRGKKLIAAAHRHRKAK